MQGKHLKVAINNLQLQYTIRHFYVERESGSSR